MIRKIALIAGAGPFPMLFAREMRKAGRTVVAVAHEGETDPELASLVDALVSIRVGQIGQMIAFFRSHGITEAVMAGGIAKKQIFDFHPDARCLSLLANVRERGDDALLRALADEMKRDGIAIVSATDLLPSLLAPLGEMTRKLSPREEEDVRFGWRIAKEIGRLEIGQCVVVREGVVLAVEAIEGSDAAIRRGGALGERNGVVVKVSKPGQDLRFDLPSVGVGTIDAMSDVAASVLAVEAGKTLVFDREAMCEKARAAHIAIVGIASC
jgi:DUF1009 family protein